MFFDYICVNAFSYEKQVYNSGDNCFGNCF